MEETWEEQATALDDGRAFVDLSAWRKVLASGSEAISWLNDLVTAAMDTLVPEEWRRTLLLDRTGRINADLHVTMVADGALLVQDPAQSKSVGALLAPYVLSSDVELTDATGELGLFSLPGRESLPSGGPGIRPSVLGQGIDALPSADRIPGVRDMLGRELTEAREQAAEVWRIRRGLPRLGVDLGNDALPAEAGWESLVDVTKGCFLGQEAVAKVRNLGHPPRMMVSFRAEIPPAPGEIVLADGDEAGRVTGMAPDGDGYAVLARVRWDARDRPLRTAAGDPLIRR